MLRPSTNPVSLAKSDSELPLGTSVTEWVKSLRASHLAPGSCTCPYGPPEASEVPKAVWHGLYGIL